jgi:hypothetical protein
VLRTEQQNWIREQRERSAENQERARRQAIADAFEAVGGKGLANPAYTNNLVQNQLFGGSMQQWLDAMGPDLGNAGIRQVQQGIYGGIGDTRQTSPQFLQNQARRIAELMYEEGYDISEEDIQGALMSGDIQGRTAFDIHDIARAGTDVGGQFNREQAMEDEAKAALDAQDAANTEATDRDAAQTESDEALARDVIMQTTGGITPEQVDPAMDLATMLEWTQVEDFDQAVDAAFKALEEIPKPSDKNEWWTYMMEETDFNDPNLLKILRAMVYA